MAGKEAGFTENKWKTMPHYECDHEGCSFDTFSLDDIKQHVASHKVVAVTVPLFDAGGKAITHREVT